jgi:2-keto-4-pentenoate hydratase
MSDDHSATLVTLLLRARRSGQPIDAAAIELAPTSPEEAYRIQRAVAARTGAMVGWKVGAKGPAAPPICAPLLAPTVFGTGASIPSTDFRLWLIESELVFRIARDCPPRADRYERSEVELAIGEVRAGFEIVDSRFATWPDIPPLLALADQQSHGAMVIGSGIPFDPAMDFTSTSVRLTFDGRPMVERQGGNPAGDPIALLVWLANHLAVTSGGLRTGDIVATGSCTGMREVKPGERAIASFDGIGSVEVARAL